MESKIVAIAFSLLILGQAYAVRKFSGTWLFPACLFGLFWFALTFIPLVLLFSVPIDPYGTGFIFLCLLAFSSSAFLFKWKPVFAANRSRDIYRSAFLKKAFYFLSIVTVACLVLDSLAQGITLTDLIFNLIATAASYREMVSFDGLTVTIYARLAEILVYDVAILGGLIVSTQPTLWKRLRVIAFALFPGAFMAVAQSTKWALFFSIALFYAGILAYRISQRNYRLLTKGAFKKLAISAVVLIAITTASFMSRGLQDESDTDAISDRLTLSFASYAAGHLYAFSDWCAFEMGRHSQISYVPEKRTHGAYTFAPIFRAAGLGGENLTAADDYYAYEDSLQSNIYTMFRGLIQDFGLPGCLLFMFAAGVAIHWAFHAMLTGQSVFPVVAFIFSIGFFYASFARSVFTWSSLYFTFALLWAVLSLAVRSESSASAKFQRVPDWKTHSSPMPTDPAV